jgi:hypothetical protein
VCRRQGGKGAHDTPRAPDSAALRTRQCSAGKCVSASAHDALMEGARRLRAPWLADAALHQHHGASE